MDWLVRELVQRETCAVVSLQSSTGLVVWIVMVCPHLLSVQPVLPELLADSEESVLEMSEWGVVWFYRLVQGLVPSLFVT
jgi:hypothetical protein